MSVRELAHQVDSFLDDEDPKIIYRFSCDLLYQLHFGVLDKAFLIHFLDSQFIKHRKGRSID